MKTVLPRSLNLFLIACLAASALSVAAGPVQAAAAVTVSTTGDEFGTGGMCSLREAVYTVNHGASFGGCRWDGVTSIHLPAGDYTLTIPNLPANSAEDEAQTGDLDIRTSLTLEGDGSDASRVTADPDLLDRVFHVKPYLGTNIQVILRGITIQGGSSGGMGGGVYNENRSTLTVTYSTLSNNRAEFAGGGIFSDGPLTISDSLITDNVGVLGGGGMYSKALATITRTFIASNKSEVPSGGAGIYKSRDELMTITDCEIIDNTGTGITNTGRLNLVNSTVQNNSAEGISNSGVLSANGSVIVENTGTGIANTGQINLANTTVQNNSVEGISNGGTLSVNASLIAGNGRAGIINKTGSGILTLFASVVTLNNEFGINNSNEATIVASTISNNLGDGILNSGDLTVRSSLVAQNQGDGISNSGALTVVNSTMSGNQKAGISSSGTALLQSLTIADNAGTGLLALGEGSSVTLQGSILARPALSAANCAVQNGAELVSAGYNLYDGLAPTELEVCPFDAEGDREGDPQLTPELGDYGGYTLTYAFTDTTPDNPALDAIPAGHAACLPTDQRLYSRPAEGNGVEPGGCDIGAYEEGGVQFLIYLPLLRK